MTQGPSNPFFTNDLEGLLKVGGVVIAIVLATWRTANVVRDAKQEIMDKISALAGRVNALSSTIAAMEDRGIPVTGFDSRITRLETMLQGTDGTDGITAHLIELRGFKHWMRNWAIPVQFELDKAAKARGEEAIEWPRERDHQRKTS